MINIVLCGGSGTRLWPISRENMPKQFLKLFNEKSLFQQTIIRNKKYFDRFIIVSNAQQFFIAKDQLEDLNLKDSSFSFIVEAIGRNTAAAVAFASFMLDKDEICFISPSDHIIEDTEEYRLLLELGKKSAYEGNLVVFGIKPTKPATGYGYIETYKSDEKVLEVKTFKEKPDLNTAKTYLEINNNKKDEREYFWNSGMFMFQAGVYLEELKKYAPEIYEGAYYAYKNAKKNDEFIQLRTEDLEVIPDISIDYAVMEKSDKLKVVKANIKWNDVGSFDALDEVLEKDENGNTKIRSLIARNSKNNFVFGKYKTIALNEVNNMIIVDTPSALLITKKGESESIKELVKLVKEKNENLIKFGRTVYRPWGYFTNIYEDSKFKVKTIVIKPGKRLSLQKHMHRSEHWVVVKGTATVQIDDKEFILRPNESTYIPIGSKHRLSNFGKIPLVVVEVQVGEYLEEDDIIRFQDDFGRIGKD